MKRLVAIALALFLVGGGTASAYTLKHPRHEHCRKHYVRHGKRCVKPKAKPKVKVVVPPSVAPAPVVSEPAQPFTPEPPRRFTPRVRELPPPYQDLVDWGVASWTGFLGTTATATEVASVSKPVEGEVEVEVEGEKTVLGPMVIGHEVTRTMTLHNPNFESAPTVTFEGRPGYVRLSERTTITYGRETSTTTYGENKTTTTIPYGSGAPCVATVVSNSQATCSITEFLPVRRELTEPKPKHPKPQPEPETRVTELELIAHYPGGVNEIQWRDYPPAFDPWQELGAAWEWTIEWSRASAFLLTYKNGVYEAD